MRAQVSLEFMLILAAYLSLIAAFAHFENGLGARMLGEGRDAADRVEANAACMLFDFFALDGRNAAMTFDRASNTTLSVEGNNVRVGTAATACVATARSGDRIGVKQVGIETA
ncbi:hypothetical protein COT29_00350 [Candidatus Micrarchaeota archaeon CG08_land_8_20_14_0_20_59_11]|nr:MAG: hypothetical protein COT29_00350 [Candidatus Micrarchaeota archaeon CG08_land_8_20_14_0_20_59_11]